MLSRAARRLLEVTLAGLGALAATLGAGLSLVGLCCGALAAAGAGTAATGAAVLGPWPWLLLTAGATLITAALFVRRRRTARRDYRLPKPTPPDHRAHGEGAIGQDLRRQGGRDAG
ncbi:hypothetical protein SGM_5202 [Streptomyces griseoaurantiacus M045]|uniref:Uncharacterized protein n=1 Tax=Streptomyces griseoaurantiacus M045 TaxID=996637 RepID=F3NQC7_9ACTN|nr:hypothetical protein SGM_5202 [Streptomyces griseoaurantiacus M045]